MRCPNRQLQALLLANRSWKRAVTGSALLWDPHAGFLLYFMRYGEIRHESIKQTCEG